MAYYGDPNWPFTPYPYGYRWTEPLNMSSGHTSGDAMWIAMPSAPAEVQAVSCQTRARSLGTLTLPARRKWHPYPLVADLINRMEG